MATFGESHTQYFGDMLLPGYSALQTTHGPSTDVSTLQTTQGPSAASWDRARPIIQKLYIDEDRKLKDVIAIMAKQYGHKATRKMYTSRLTKWGMAKNNRAADMAFMARKKRQRDEEGKSSTFVVRGKKVKGQEVERCVRRKRGKDPDFEEAPVDAATPGYIWYLSAPPSPVVEADDGEMMIREESSVVLFERGVVPARSRKRKRSMTEAVKSWNGLFSRRAYRGVREGMRSPSVSMVVTAPDIFRKHELLFANISNYVAGSIGNGAWLIDERGGLSKATKQMAHPADFRNLLWQAAEFFKTSLYIQGRLFASKGFSLLPTILREESPTALERFLTTFLILSQLGSMDLCAMIQGYMRELASTVLPEQHIWRQICISISLTDPAQPEETTRILGCLAESLTRFVGPFSHAGIAIELDFIHRTSNNDLLREELLLRQLLTDYRRTTGRIDDTEQYIADRLIHNLLSQREYAAAEALLEDSLWSARKFGSISMYQAVRLKEFLAWAQYKQTKALMAESNLRNVIAGFSKTEGREGALTIHCYDMLEGWLREWGREEEADELQAEIDEMIVRTTSTST